MGRAENVCLDGFARRMMENVIEAIGIFLDEPQCPAPQDMQTKLAFAYTDFLRLAHVHKRLLQRLLWLRWPVDTPNPRSLGVCAFALAIRGWLRQVDVHAAYYRYMSRLKRTAAASASGGSGTDSELASTRARPKPAWQG